MPQGSPSRPEQAETASAWDGVADRLRAAGQRWTPQRRTLVEVLREHTGHVTATELIARCRELDSTTTPSTVYRSLDLLEDIGLVSTVTGRTGARSTTFSRSRSTAISLASGAEAGTSSPRPAPRSSMRWRLTSASRWTFRT